MKYFVFTILSVCVMFFVGQSEALAQSKFEKGKATYYGKKFNNRKTASGQIYKSTDLVCAHKTYPFGTKLLVRNLKNNKKVVVEVIDRGPFSKGRIIDLSYAAAKKIDMVGHGVVSVEVTEYTDSVQPYKLDDIILPKPFLSLSTKN